MFQSVQLHHLYHSSNGNVTPDHILNSTTTGPTSILASKDPLAVLNKNNKNNNRSFNKDTLRKNLIRKKLNYRLSTNSSSTTNKKIIRNSNSSSRGATDNSTNRNSLSNNNSNSSLNMNPNSNSGLNFTPSSNNNNNNSSDDNPPPPPPNNNNNAGTLKKSNGQTLIQKLQNIYKLIVAQELELQDKCSKLSTSQSTKLKYLWSIYKLNYDLINNYILFILTALSPSQSTNDQIIGKEILEIYKIEKRLWIYGTITFLDILKNFANFLDPEISSQFITHVFESISNMISDLPSSFANPWYQRLGDLSRMAIALYPSNFIDWKLSAEFWYIESLKFTFGHGKLYYHISTVQQNPLMAFVNLGKSVFCFDTFIPSQRYMQLVIDNIYQRAFISEKSSMSSSSYPMTSKDLLTNTSFAKNFQQKFLIDYLKHSEVILLPNFLENENLKLLVLNYFDSKFGKIFITLNEDNSSASNISNMSSNTIPNFSENRDITSDLPINNNSLPRRNANVTSYIDMFNFRNIFKQKNIDILKYFFKNSSTFAQSHILQLVGFGNPKNPFAILFQLPKCLKEKKSKKKLKSNSNNDDNTYNNNISNNSSDHLPATSSSTTSFSTSHSVSNRSVDQDIDSNSISDLDNNLSSSVSISAISSDEFFDNLESLKNSSIFLPITLDIWNQSLSNLNRVSLNTSMTVLKKFLNGPIFISLPHFLSWTYFLISLALKIESLESIESRIFWLQFIKKIFPWNSIVNYLNVLISITLDNTFKTSIINNFVNMYSKKNLDELLIQFNENEYELPEIWNCWGSLWFDVIAENYQIYSKNSSLNIDSKDEKCLNFPIDGLPFDEHEENGTNFWKRICRVIFLYKAITTRFNGFGGLTISNFTSVHCNRNDIPSDHILRSFSFKLLPDEANEKDNNSNINDNISGLNRNNMNDGEKEVISLLDINTNSDLDLTSNVSSTQKYNIDNWENFEKISERNMDMNWEPSLSLIEGENIFEYEGYKKFYMDFDSFDKNGELISTSLYTSNIIDEIVQERSGNSNESDDGSLTELNRESTIISNLSAMSNTSNTTIGMNNNNNNNSGTDKSDDNEYDLFNAERIILNKILDPDYKDLNLIWKEEVFFDDNTDFNKTYFVLDATSWLRHFAHIYKLATNNVLRFAVCLTTFQELRFLRKSKDENVIKAATCAIITLRQLYSERRLLPLRFTGNIATHIEEHLEFEEQITWRSHVDEFVIEAIKRAQLKKREQKNEELPSSQQQPADNEEIQLTINDMSFALVTDDISMIKKRQEEDTDNNIVTFSTKFVFSLCNVLVNKLHYTSSLPSCIRSDSTHDDNSVTNIENSLAEDSHETSNFTRILDSPKRKICIN